MSLFNKSISIEALINLCCCQTLIYFSAVLAEHTYGQSCANGSFTYEKGRVNLLNDFSNNFKWYLIYNNDLQLI